MSEWTYQIDSVNRFVYRINPNREICGTLSFHHLQKMKPHLKEGWGSKQWIDTDQGREVYLIARDELIDRGLIKDE